MQLTGGGAGRNIEQVIFESVVKSKWQEDERDEWKLRDLIYHTIMSHGVK